MIIYSNMFNLKHVYIISLSINLHTCGTAGLFCDKNEHKNTFSKTFFYGAFWHVPNRKLFQLLAITCEGELKNYFLKKFSVINQETIHLHSFILLKC